jgi:toxin ParE1/3/4
VRVLLASPAQRELLEALDFYERLAPGLAVELLDEFDGVIVQIADFPNSGSPYLYGTRRLLLQRFPFGVVYRLKPDAAEVIAFAHQARRPGYWGEKR